MLNTLIQVIKQHLATERRLVVPRLGVFLVKDDHTILFSELMRRDDEVLRKLLVAEGMNELAAIGAIDRLIFEVHQAIEEQKAYELPGLGSFEAGPNSTIAFRYNPRLGMAEESVAPVVEQPVVVPVAEVKTRAEREVMPVVEVEAPAVEIVETPAEPICESAAEESVADDPVHSEPTTGTVEQDHYEDAYEDEYEYEEEDRAIARSMRRGAKRHRPQRKSGPDRFVVAAVVAVLLALAAIAFGYYCEWSEAQGVEETHLEQTAGSTDGGQSTANDGAKL